MKIQRWMLGAAAAAMATGYGVASAQDQVTAPDATQTETQQVQVEVVDETQDAQAQGQQQATQCSAEMQQMATRMQEEGYWLTGWTGRGMGGAGVGAGADPMMDPAADPAMDPAVDPAMQDPAMQDQAAMDPAMQGGPWGNVAWTTDPRFEIRTLYSAAAILDRRGDEQGCQAVVAQLDNVYSEYVTELGELGVNPDEVMGWRQEQIVGSVPVTEMGAVLRTDDIIGTEVRNPQDEYLGSIDDVVLDPNEGNIRYVVVSRGGFLGIGTDYVAVPWDQLRATAGLNTFVLPVSYEAMENAPTYDMQQVGSAEQFQTMSNDIDTYWQQNVTTSQDTVGG